MEENELQTESAEIEEFTDLAEATDSVDPTNSTNSSEPVSQGTESVKSRNAAKSNWRHKMILDIAVLIFAIVLAKYFTKPSLAKQDTALFYYYENASVVSIDEIEFTGTEEEAKELGDFANSKYAVTVEYPIGPDAKTKVLYFKEKPKFDVFSILELKISVLDPDNVTIVE